MRLLAGSIALVLAALLLTGATSGNTAYVSQVEKWRQERLDRLRGEDGWLTLIGLYWLKPGENSVGSAASDRVVLPAGKAPAQVGTLVLEDKQTVKFRPAKGVKGLTVDGKPVKGEIALRNDAVEGQKPNVVGLGSLRFHIIVREDKVGVRLRDTKSPARKALTRLEHFPVDPKWRIEAKFVPYNPPKKIQYMNVLGQLVTDNAVGAVLFTVNGYQYRLDATQDPETRELSFVFGDKTNGVETYGGGRFLDTPPPNAEGMVDMDFNKAYSPPCSFTPYATCPLPSEDNKLPIRIQAGEKSKTPAHHIAQIK